MKRWMKLSLVVAVGAVLTAGCGGDALKQAMSNPEMQGKVMDMISGSMPMATQMLDKFMANDSLKTAILSKVMGDEGMMQQVVAQVAGKQDLVDKVLDTAVQDPAMKEHIMGWVKGMAAASKK